MMALSANRSIPDEVVERAVRRAQKLRSAAFRSYLAAFFGMRFSQGAALPEPNLTRT